MTGFFWEPEALPALKLKEHLLALICVSGRQLTLLSLVWYGLVWSGESPSVSPDNPIEWTHSQPSWCVNLLLRGNSCHALVDLCFPRLWNVFCVHVILKDGPRKVNFLVFPCRGQSWWHLPPGSGDRHLPSHPGSQGHPQHSLQTTEPVQWVKRNIWLAPWESPFDFWARPGTPTWLTEKQPQSLACFVPLDYTSWFLALPH